MLKIWGRNTSINVQKVMWAIGELGMPHERIDVGGAFGSTKEPFYLAMNPNSLVPTLEEDDGFILWESNTVVRYLAAKHGAGTLEPADPHERARASQWMDWMLTVCAPAIHPLFWGLIRTPPEKRDHAKIDEARDEDRRRAAHARRAARQDRVRRRRHVLDGRHPGRADHLPLPQAGAGPARAWASTIWSAGSSASSSARRSRSRSCRCRSRELTMAASPASSYICRRDALRGIAATAATIAGPRLAAAQAPSMVEERWSAGGLVGTFARPVGEPTRGPAAVILAGSGPNLRDGTLGTYRRIAEGLAAGGIRSVRYDKRGIGESRALVVREDDVVLQNFVDDAVTAARDLQARSDVSAVVIVGHSEGAPAGHSGRGEVSRSQASSCWPDPAAASM